MRGRPSQATPRRPPSCGAAAGGASLNASSTARARTSARKASACPFAGGAPSRRGRAAACAALTYMPARSEHQEPTNPRAVAASRGDVGLEQHQVHGGPRSTSAGWLQTSGPPTRRGHHGSQLTEGQAVSLALPIRSRRRAAPAFERACPPCFSSSASASQLPRRLLARSSRTRTVVLVQHDTPPGRTPRSRPRHTGGTPRARAPGINGPGTAPKLLREPLDQLRQRPQLLALGAENCSSSAVSFSGTAGMVSRAPRNQLGELAATARQ